MWFDLDTWIDGVNVQVCYWPVEPLQREMSRGPFLFFSLSHGRILAEQHQRIGQSYFRQHSGIRDIWIQQLEELRQARIHGRYENGRFRMSPGCMARHPDFGSFAGYLRQAAAAQANGTAT